MWISSLKIDLMVVLDASVGDEMQILGLSHTVTCRFWEER
jgi:hypothetical protein